MSQRRRHFSGHTIYMCNVQKFSRIRFWFHDRMQIHLASHCTALLCMKWSVWISQERSKHQNTAKCVESWEAVQSNAALTKRILVGRVGPATIRIFQKKITQIRLYRTLHKSGKSIHSKLANDQIYFMIGIWNCVCRATIFSTFMSCILARIRRAVPHCSPFSQALIDESKLMKSEATLALFMRPWSGSAKTPNVP